MLRSIFNSIILYTIHYTTNNEECVGFGTYMWKVNTAQCPFIHNDSQRTTHTMTHNNTNTNTRTNIHMKTDKHTETRWHTTHTYTHNDIHLHSNYHPNLLTHTIINTHSISLRMFHYVSLCEILLVYIISFVFVLFVLLWAWSRACNF